MGTAATPWTLQNSVPVYAAIHNGSEAVAVIAFLTYGVAVIVGPAGRTRAVDLIELEIVDGPMGSIWSARANALDKLKARHELQLMDGNR